MQKRILLILFAISITVIAFASRQEDDKVAPRKKITILHADIAYPGRDTMPTRLIGNVMLAHNDVVITCDSLHQYDYMNFVKAYSNVHMVQNDTLNLWGDWATYDGDTQLAKVRNNVTLQDPDITLTTDFLDYDADARIGHYFNHGHIVDDINTLDSEYGYYYMNIKQMFFWTDVVVVNPEYLMVSDTMRYHTEQKIITIVGPTTIYGDDRTLYSEDGWYNSITAHAELYKNNHLTFSSYKGVADTIIADSVTNLVFMYHNIELLDTINDILVEGEYGELQNDNDYAFVTDHAILTMIGSPDSLFLHGDTLTMQKEFYEADSIEANVMTAFYKVRFFNEDLRGRSDSMSFTTIDSIVHLYNDPVVWAQDNQMTATYIDMKMRDGMADEFHLKDNSMIINPMDSATIVIIDSNMYNQIRGRDITGYIRDNQLYKIYVDGSGETIYYPDDNGVPFALANVLSSEIMIYLEDQHIEDITFINKPEGTMNPMFLVTPDEQFLKGFSWRIVEKPISKEDIFRIPFADEPDSLGVVASEEEGEFVSRTAYGDGYVRGSGVSESDTIPVSDKFSTPEEEEAMREELARQRSLEADSLNNGEEGMIYNDDSGDSSKSSDEIATESGYEGAEIEGEMTKEAGEKDDELNGSANSEAVEVEGESTNEAGDGTTIEGEDEGASSDEGDESNKVATGEAVEVEGESSEIDESEKGDNESTDLSEETTTNETTEVSQDSSKKSSLSKKNKGEKKSKAKSKNKKSKKNKSSKSKGKKSKSK